MYVRMYLSISMYLSTYLHRIERYIDMMYVYVYLWKPGVLTGNACTVLEYFLECIVWFTQLPIDPRRLDIRSLGS